MGKCKRSLQLQEALSPAVADHVTGHTNVAPPPQPIVPADWLQGQRLAPAAGRGWCTCQNLHLLLYFSYLGDKCYSPYSLSLLPHRIRYSCCCCCFGFLGFFPYLQLVSNQLSHFNSGIHLEFLSSSKVTMKVSCVEGESQLIYVINEYENTLLCREQIFSKCKALIPFKK